MKNIHFFQHVSFEGPAEIGKWIDVCGYSTSFTRFYQGEAPPEPVEADLLVVLGGPMNIYQEKEYPWLVKEKKAIEQAISKGMKVLGICLGAQLIARVLGAEIFKNPEKEIGWFPVTLTEAGKNSNFFRNFPSSFSPLHWHGDTFEIPKGAVHLAKSEGCINQAFSYGENVLALQFHLESNKDSIEKLITNSAEDLNEPGRFVQRDESALLNRESIAGSSKLLFEMIDSFL
jgi:GMP synthase (glutamine-hydrolysing)